MMKNNILKTSSVIKHRLLSVKQVYYENYDEKQYIKNVKRYKTNCKELFAERGINSNNSSLKRYFHIALNYYLKT